MNPRVRAVFSPPASISQPETSLRYTDILFGFVIRELFLRLQNWQQLPTPTKWHLVVGASLVLGSWIGYRRSLNRTDYDVKFFNLPLVRFLVDQLMLILYFRIAVLTPIDRSNPLAPDALAAGTIALVVNVFVLYVAWDLLGIWMANAKTIKDGKRKLKYSKVEGGKIIEDKKATTNWVGLSITIGGLTIFAVLWLLAHCIDSTWLLAITGAVLLGYRWAKDYRTAWISLGTTQVS
jgi:hypothetical protein